MKKLLDYMYLFLVAGVVIALDQWTKMLVRTLPLNSIWLPEGWQWLEPYARVVHWYNTGAAFGSFAGFGPLFTLLAFVVVGVILYYYPQVEAADWWLRVALGMQMGGALGNVIDRLTQNMKVTDFISLGNFAVFNLADASITVGVVILMIGLWIKEMEDRRKLTPAAVDETAVEAPLEAPADEPLEIPVSENEHFDG